MRQLESFDCQPHRLSKNCGIRSAGSGKNQCELFPANACGYVYPTRGKSDQFRSQQHQPLIASLMSLRIVKRLEVIDIHHYQREFLTTSRQAGAFLLELLIEQSPV